MVHPIKEMKHLRQTCSLEKFATACYENFSVPMQPPPRLFIESHSRETNTNFAAWRTSFSSLKGCHQQRETSKCPARNTIVKLSCRQKESDTPGFVYQSFECYSRICFKLYIGFAKFNVRKPHSGCRSRNGGGMSITFDHLGFCNAH